MFDLDIVSSPGAALFPHAPMWDVDMGKLRSYDEDLVKPAILFADSIKLWSERIDMMDVTASRAFRVTHMPMRMVHNFLGLSWRSDPKEIDALGIQPGILVSPEEPAGFIEGNQSGSMDALETFAQEHESRITEVAEATFELLRVRHEYLESTALKSLEEEGVLSSCGWAEDNNDPWSLAWEDENQFFTRSLLELTRRLPESRNALLLEPGSNFFLRYIRKRKPGTVRKGQGANTEAVGPLLSASAVAFSVIGRIPGLADVSIPDLVEIRYDLQDYLTPFRAETASIAEKLAEQAGGSHAEVERVLASEWHTHLSPALAELDRKVQRGGYPRQLLTAFSEDRTAITSTVASVVLAGGSLFAGLGALVPAMAAASVPFMKALNSTLKARDDASDNRLYFLYEARNRASSLSPTR